MAQDLGLQKSEGTSAGAESRIGGRRARGSAEQITKAKRGAERIRTSDLMLVRLATTPPAHSWSYRLTSNE